MKENTEERLEAIHYRTGERISIELSQGRIAAITKSEDANGNPDELPWVAPGLVDLQVNGWNGLDLNTLPLSEKTVAQLTEALWREGVTAYCPTIITNSDEAIEAAMSTIAAACSGSEWLNACIPGLHLEGPFISPQDGSRGAHDRRYVKAPDWALFERWQDAAEGRIKIITLSPEWDGAAQFIARCVDSGVKVSIGHTSAAPEQIREAAAAGASMSTHLGNGAHPLLPRHPNYIWEQLADDRLWGCVIADGFHLPASVLKVALRAKGAKLLMVSDAVYLSGMEPGEYETHIGGRVTLTPEGRLHLSGQPKLLAGSALPLTAGVRHMWAEGLCSFAEAWELASLRPSECMGLPTAEGLAVGAPGDLVLFGRSDDGIRIERTYKSGKPVYEAAHVADEYAAAASEDGTLCKR
ncbi:amidohydrolase family protein [Paenibacillus sp. RC67]|uniref:N-acetylglucosamine-6-phosphate deacetylase n=1 Tax=Paenibacillus sp. RC67 TaxID=3039392 RepID=UPI0024ACA003|nr:amidohydrolase family protein [Paenibacillus sp. RC67]